MKFIRHQIERSDEKDLKNFYADLPSPGGINFCMEREPDFFGALDVEGDYHLILSIKDNDTGKLACAGIRGTKICYIDGIPADIGYLSSLRVGNEYRNTIVLGRFFQFYHTYWQNEPKLYIASVFNDNLKGKQTLTSGKGDLPVFKDIGLFRTIIFRPAKFKYPNPHSEKFSIRLAITGDIDEITEFLNINGKQRQFFPVYKKSHFNSGHGLLKNLKLNDIALCYSGNELIGTMALWDQSSFRQWKVKSYSGIFKYLRPVIIILSWILGKPILPKAGKALHYKNIALLCIKDNNYEVFQLLLDNFVNEYRHQKDIFFAIGFHESDPFGIKFKIRGFVLKSRIYIAYWKEYKEFADKVTPCDPYFELGAL